MKRVLLVNPIYNAGYIPKNIPLSKIASGLKKCCIDVHSQDFVSPDCEHRNLNYFKDAEEQFYDNVINEACRCDIVYITSSTGCELKPYPLFPRIVEIAKRIKKYTNARILVGGAFVNLLVFVYKIDTSLLKGGYIDEVIIGNEYNGVMNNIVQKHWPASTHIDWSIWKDSLYPYYTSVQYHIGCPYACNFCFEGVIFSPRDDLFLLDDFILSIKQKKIIIEDSVLISYRDFDQLITKIMQANVSFAAYARIDEIVKNPDRVRQLNLAGCKSLIIGIETLNSSILANYNKSIISNDTLKAIEILRQYDIKIQGCFMLGFPNDTIENMENTIKFAVEQDLSGYRWHIFQPNYADFPKDLHVGEDIDVKQILEVQLNVPDCCLHEVVCAQPHISLLDEHFMFRSKSYIAPSVFERVYYKNKFSYRDVRELIDATFPSDWVLNEEKLYPQLF